MTTRFRIARSCSRRRAARHPAHGRRRPGTIEGVVVDTRGAPLAGASVTITCGAVTKSAPSIAAAASASPACPAALHGHRPRAAA
jgi:hypothetical protein